MNIKVWLYFKLFLWANILAKDFKWEQFRLIPFAWFLEIPTNDVVCRFEFVLATRYSVISLS